MKVIKNNAHIYKTLYESLEGDTHENSEKVELRFVNTAELKDSNKLESHFNTLNNINTQLKNLNDVDLVLNLLLKSLRGLITVEESQIFLFNENQFELNHVGKNCDNRLKSLVDLSFKNGIISWIFESKKSVILPNLIRSRTTKPGDELIEYMSLSPHSLYRIIGCFSYNGIRVFSQSLNYI